METFRSIPFKPRELKASQEVLDKIYEAAKLGLKGDALAFAADMLPMEYRRLCQMDGAAAIAEAKGRADSEFEAANQLRVAALGGDSKAALALLQHVHGWVAKTQSSEPILFPKLRIHFADFPYLHYSIDQRLLTLET